MIISMKNCKVKKTPDWLHFIFYSVPQENLGDKLVLPETARPLSAPMAGSSQKLLSSPRIDILDFPLQNLTKAKNLNKGLLLILLTFKYIREGTAKYYCLKHLKSN